MTLEKALVGAILQKNSVIADIANITSPVDMEDHTASEVYKFVLSRWMENKETDIIIAARSGLNPVWLAESTDEGFPSMAVSYAEQIAEMARVKRLKNTLGVISKNNTQSQDILDDMANLLISEAGTDEDIADANECVSEFDEMLKAGGISGFSTGYYCFDNLDISLIKGDYWVVGAGTNVGKTAFALNVFCYLLENLNAKICMISTEMTRKQLLSRMLAYFTHIPANKIIKNNLQSDIDQENVQKAMKLLESKTFFISEKTFEISAIENKVRGLNLKHDIDIVFIDYLQHCRSKQYKDRYSVLTDVTARLQELAKVSETCIVALSQLSNDAVKNPKGSLEFKGSGDIAGDCDVGIVLEVSDVKPEVLNVRIKKNRHGGKGIGKLKYNLSFSKLEEFG